MTHRRYYDLTLPASDQDESGNWLFPVELEAYRRTIGLDQVSPVTGKHFYQSRRTPVRTGVVRGESGAYYPREARPVSEYVRLARFWEQCCIVESYRLRLLWEINDKGRVYPDWQSLRHSREIEAFITRAEYTTHYARRSGTREHGRFQAATRPHSSTTWHHLVRNTGILREMWTNVYLPMVGVNLGMDEHILRHYCEVMYERVLAMENDFIPV